MDNVLGNHMKTQSVETIKTGKYPIIGYDHKAINGPSSSSDVINLGCVDSTRNMGLICDNEVMEVNLVPDSFERKRSNVCGRTLTIGDEFKPVNVNGLKEGRWKHRARVRSRIDSGMPHRRRLRPSAERSSSSTFSGRLLPSVVVVVVFLQLSSSSSTFSRHDVVNFKMRDLQPS
ncbi:hypothetical protein LWI28_028040 [Acer negundo]|uniref:Uncharacterized protein n=1 Tax=Acer negundo TaxID=4023 RepID=A0AAD5JFR3_ACENE|nr:hypothetical protein LWI28_028040 [Acer negundo]